MFPVICHGCGQRGKVASIPSDLACVACRSTDIDLDDRTAARDTDLVHYVCTRCKTKGSDFASNSQKGSLRCADCGATGGDLVLVEAKQASNLGDAVVETMRERKGRPSNECPKCGAKTSPVQSVDGQSLSAKCNACGWTGTKRKYAVGLDPSEPMGLLPSGVPEQDADVALLTQDEKARRVVVPQGSAPYTQRALQTSAAAPIKNCPLCGMKDTVKTQNYGDEKGQHCTYCGAKDADLEQARKSAAADQRRPEEIALQRELEAKPPSQMTGEEAIDLRRLREQQGGQSDIANPYSGGNPYRAARNGDLVTVTYTDDAGIHTIAGRAQVRPSGLMRVAGSIIAPHQIVRLANQDGSADATGHTFTKGEGTKCEVEGCDNAAQGDQKRCEQHTERDQASATARLNVKVEQIAQAVLASNPGMERKQARRIALKTVGRYPKVAG